MSNPEEPSIHKQPKESSDSDSEIEEITMVDFESTTVTQEKETQMTKTPLKTTQPSELNSGTAAESKTLTPKQLEKQREKEAKEKKRIEEKLAREKAKEEERKLKEEKRLQEKKAKEEEKERIKRENELKREKERQEREQKKNEERLRKEQERLKREEEKEKERLRKEEEKRKAEEEKRKKEEEAEKKKSKLKIKPIGLIVPVPVIKFEILNADVSLPVDPLKDYWSATVVAETTEPSTGPDISVEDQPKPKKTKSLITVPEDLELFASKVQGCDFTVPTMVEILKKELPKYTKGTIETTLKTLAKRVGPKMSEKRWEVDTQLLKSTAETQ
ncbi:Reticulocyte-binding protein 2 a [Cyberlindnera fabianii]|uniref:Reticulocyte-binding protein 2 a n=1 Tax=Cyberlindnera fabianii TaxID=36022 RepID=A0A1V2L653_CYBFA|nr:Reticulocyte-binding protein 2 a [Cyberlindnera fabianii]